MKLVNSTIEDLEDIYKVVSLDNKYFDEEFPSFLQNFKRIEKKYNCSYSHIEDNGELVCCIRFMDHPFASNSTKIINIWARADYRNVATLKKLYDFSISNFPQKELSAAVYEDEKWKLDFYKSLSMQEESRLWRSYMNPQLYKKVELDNDLIRFESFEKFLCCDENFIKFYHLDRELVKLIPAEFPMEELSYDHFREIIDNSKLDSSLSFVAYYNDELAGMCTVALDASKASVMLTGVRKKFHGLGIGFALKQEATLACKDRGIEYISTMNDASNLPMLALNKKFSFTKEITKVVLKKVIA
ncbi:GNAT family N-acetyltransferase [Halobacteriovorax sp. HLS]|uniref:GNAT family N-acetyltransferase n=1 Tax=Halobacteriovorax sp. HLS TaxID=2234000 RepID=UPI000FD98FBB|nr:GNAT family N-acetyltransferase [Halobacteriovorax sp. HLS]